MEDSINYVPISIGSVVRTIQSPTGSRKTIKILDRNNTPFNFMSLMFIPLFRPFIKELLVDDFEAHPAGFFGDEVKCLIPEDRLSDFKDWLYEQIYCNSENSDIEWLPYVELCKMFVAKYWNYTEPPLTTFELDLIEIDSPVIVQQPLLFENAIRKNKEHFVNLSVGWNMLPEIEVYNKLVTFPSVYILNEVPVAYDRSSQKIVNFGGYYKHQS